MTPYVVAPVAPPYRPPRRQRALAVWLAAALAAACAPDGAPTPAADAGAAAPAAAPDGNAAPVRSALPGSGGATTDGVFRIDPQRPVAELRAAALSVSPPEEAGPFRGVDLVEVRALDPTIRYDIRYATDSNFMGEPFYTSAHAYLQRDAARALVRAHRALAGRGYGILVHDAYRPWHVTKMFWDATPPDLRAFVANPADGSRHNRGAAADVTLYRREDGEPVEMPSGYDEFTERAAADYAGGTEAQRQRRGVLREAMEAEGFTVLPEEWWHFDYRDWREYPILDLTFEEIQ